MGKRIVGGWCGGCAAAEITALGLRRSRCDTELLGHLWNLPRKDRESRIERQ